MKKENIRLMILREMSYPLLHFLIERNILREFVIEANIWFNVSLTYPWESRGCSEFGAYFPFSQSTTFSENKWYRYLWEYQQYYPKYEKLK